MKLYATTTSERATKGQGGEYLMIEVMGANKEVIARIQITQPEAYKYKIDMYPVVYPDTLTIDVKGHGYKLNRTLSEQEKGEKKKGECRHHYNYKGNTDTLCDRCTSCNKLR